MNYEVADFSLKVVYLTMSAKDSDSDFILYGILYLAHRAFTCG